MKGSVGTIDMKGTMSGGMGFDSAGLLAKSVQDCADVMNVLLSGRNFRSHLTKSWDGIGIAYLDYKAWQFADRICDQTRAFDDEHVWIDRVQARYTNAHFFLGNRHD